MPQPNYDPDDPDEVWDHVRKTILDAVNSEDLETPQLYAAIAARLLPDFSKLQAAQLALELFIEQHGDGNEFQRRLHRERRNTLGPDRNGRTSACSGLRKKSSNAPRLKTE